MLAFFFGILCTFTESDRKIMSLQLCSNKVFPLMTLESKLENMAIADVS